MQHRFNQHEFKYLSLNNWTKFWATPLPISFTKVWNYWLFSFE